MSSIIVLDSSDEDEAPSKKSLVKMAQNAATITLGNKPKQISAKKQQHKINANSNISKKQQNIISNNLLSPSASTTTIAKPKVSTLPKINAAFTLNAIERHTPTPPKTNITNLTTAAVPISISTAIPATITATQQRKRKTPTPPKPVATTISTGGNTMLLSSILHQNAAAGVTNLANMTHLTNMANMLPMIQSVQSMAPSTAPPMQLLATPPSLTTAIDSLAAIDPRMMHSFSNSRSSNPVDNFKIHLPLKRPNSAISSSSAANSPTSNSRNSPPTTTAAVLRNIKRIKPTTLLKHSDEAWHKRQPKASTSSSIVAGQLLHDDDLFEVFPPISPASSTATASASSSPSPAHPIASPKSQTPQMPKLQPAPKQQSRPRSQITATRVQASTSTSVTTATTRIRTPPVKTSAVLDLTNSPERPKVTTTTSNAISPPPPLTPKMPGLPATPMSTSSSTTSDESGKPATPETKSDTTATTENNAVEKYKTPPREPLIPDYEELIKVCRTADPSDDMEKLIKQKLMRYYYSVHPDFLRSRGFRKQLRSTIDRINADPELVYYNLKTIVEELKVRRKSSQVIVTNDETSAAATGGSTGNKHTDEQIRKLNKALYIVTKRIDNLEESEVDWDDDDSSYLQVERFKKRACQIYEKICDLTGESKSALRLVRKPIQFSGTSFPQFNRTLQAYVNQTKEFPDYHDVIRMLEHCNGLYSLGLAQFEMKRIAQDAFIKVGKLLQSRRKTDLYETVAHYTANAEDPAEKDASLLAKLSENKKKCTKIGEIIEKFAREQDLSADELKEARLKKSITTSAENSKDVGVEGEKKVDEDDDEDDDDEEDDDEDEPSTAVADIEDDAERLTNGDMTDEDSDVDSKSEIKKKKNDSEKAEPATVTDSITSKCTTTTTTKQTIVDPLKKYCDINTKINDVAIIQSHSSNISNESNSTLITNKITNKSEIHNKTEIERDQTGGSGDSNTTAKDKATPSSTVKSVRTSPGQIPNGKVSTTTATSKQTSTAISTTAHLPPAAAASLKIVSVSSLNASVNKFKNNNSSAISPSPSSAIQRTVAEIVISDEES